MNKTAIQKAVDLFGNNQAALARHLRVTTAYVNKMVKSGHVPVEQCRGIESATGGQVTAEELRPDIFLPRNDAA